jgi:hypothetical protein
VLGSPGPRKPNPHERLEEPDLLRAHRADGGVDAVFGCADGDAVKLAELVHGRKLVQARADGRHPRLPDRQVDARRERHETEAQDEKAPLPITNAEEPEWLQEGNGAGHRADQAQVEQNTAKNGHRLS